MPHTYVHTLEALVIGLFEGLSLIRGMVSLDVDAALAEAAMEGLEGDVTLWLSNIDPTCRPLLSVSSRNLKAPNVTCCFYGNI